MDWENQLESNPIQKIEKKCKKNKVKLFHFKKKTMARKRIFLPTPFSHSTLKLKLKNLTPQNHLLFCATSCFSVTEITTLIGLQENQEKV